MSRFLKMISLEIIVQNGLPLLLCGRENEHLLIEPASSPQSVVQQIRLGGSGQHENAVCGLQSVDAGEQLADDLRVFLIILIALGADCVDLIDDDYREVAGLRRGKTSG